MFPAWPSLHSAASHPLIHLSRDSFSSLCLCDIHISIPSLSPFVSLSLSLSLSLPVFHPPPYWAISLLIQWINFTEFLFLCIKGQQCVSGDGVVGGLSKPRFNLPSGCPHVLSWALSVITGRYLAKWNYVSSLLFSSLLFSSLLFYSILFYSILFSSPLLSSPLLSSPLLSSPPHGKSVLGSVAFIWSIFSGQSPSALLAERYASSAQDVNKHCRWNVTGYGYITLMCIFFWRYSFSFN